MKINLIFVISFFYVMCIFNNLYAQSTDTTVQTTTTITASTAQAATLSTVGATKVTATTANNNSSNTTTVASTTKSGSPRNAAPILITIPFICFRLFNFLF